MEEKEEIEEVSKSENTAYNDTDFCSFYYKAVKRLLDIDNKANISYLYRYAKIFNKYYDKFCQVKFNLEDKDDEMIKLLKESLYYRLIYIYKNAALLSSAVAFHFRNACVQHQIVIQRFARKKLVKICSIGGNSVGYIVAIITVLKSISLQSDVELDFRVTIIDFNIDWKNTCFIVLSCLEEFREATWKINFIQCNLAKINTWTPDTLKAIQNADVVTMVKYISKHSNKWNIVKTIWNKLQDQAMFFILDRPVANLIELYFCILDLNDYHLIHMELCDYHALDVQAVKHLRTLYGKSFGNDKQLSSSISCDVFVSVWMKSPLGKDTRYKDNLEYIFQIHDEKYDPKQSFLSHNALARWEILFSKKKISDGWNTKCIKKYVEEEKGNRNKMIGEFIHLSKEVDSLQNQLLDRIRTLKKDRTEFRVKCKDSFDDYLNLKKQYTSMKKTAYFKSLSGKYLCSTFK